ncbi:MAG: glycoside hydrolase family 97 catalytic domain-containing protein [Bacteroidota bacterium]
MKFFLHKNLKQTIIVFLTVYACTPFSIFAQSSKWPVTIHSPDKRLQMQFTMNELGEVYYNFTANGKLLLQPSRIGLDIKGKPVFKSKKLDVVNKIWEPVWGKRNKVPDQYTELQLVFDSFAIKARVYNNGIAFKYDGAGAETELTQFNFAGNYTAWSYKVEDHNVGPERLMDAGDGERLPVMTIKADENNYLAVHEAALESGEPLRLQVRKNTTLMTIPSKRGKAWRVILYGRSAGDLVDSHLIELLNPPATSDFSWVKPGLAVWDWRINGAVVDGFKYEMSLPSWKRMVDFSSANNISSFVLDANWYGPEFDKKSDPTSGGKVDQVRQILAYGKQKNVGIWLYLNDVGGKRFPIEETIRQYSNWGAVGIKYGFMSGSFEEKNIRTQLITRLCAENHLMVDFHDNPVHPYGQMRTYPNAATREYNHAQSDAHRVFQPKTFVTAVFVNMLAGPLDMNNGAMDMQQKGRVDNSKPIPSTIVAEAARTLITFSGATIIPDIPENYTKHQEILKFISAQKMPWKESKTLSGVIGEQIVMARQAADGNWLVGAATNEDARDISIPLSFLSKGVYEASLVEDGKDADFRTNKESYITSVKTVDHKQTITVHLAPGGGACILLKKKK